MIARKAPARVAPEMRIPRWRAFDSRGEAHAFLSRTAPASACGKVTRPADERHDWPTSGRAKCPACVAAVSR